MPSTQKQISYVLFLLGKCGFPTRYMTAEFKRLGARCNQRSGSVEAWVRGMNATECSQLIDRLKSMEVK